MDTNGRWRLSSSVVDDSSSSVVVCNTLICNVTHQRAARDGGPVVLRPVRATPCFITSGYRTPVICQFKWRIWIIFIMCYFKNLYAGNGSLPGPTRVLNANGISIASEFSAWLTSWQTDRPNHSVVRNRRHIDLRSKGKERKGKKEYLYSANTPCLPFLRKRSPAAPTKMFYYLSFVSASAPVRSCCTYCIRWRHSVTWLNCRWWLAAWDWPMSRVMKYDTIAIEL